MNFQTSLSRRKRINIIRAISFEKVEYTIEVKPKWTLLRRKKKKDRYLLSQLATYIAPYLPGYTTTQLPTYIAPYLSTYIAAQLFLFLFLHFCMQPEAMTTIKKYLFRAKSRDLITCLIACKHIYTARFFLQNSCFRTIRTILARNYPNHPPAYQVIQVSISWQPLWCPVNTEQHFPVLFWQ